MAAPIDLLSRVELFRDLDKRELQDVAGAMKEYTYEPGREIVTQGTGGVGFFVIADSQMGITRGAGGLVVVGRDYEAVDDYSGNDGRGGSFVGTTDVLLV